jgi:hypothetical protein
VEEAGASLFSVVLELDGPEIVVLKQLVYAKAVVLETVMSGVGCMHTVYDLACHNQRNHRQIDRNTDSINRLLPGLCICAWKLLVLPLS